MAPAPVATSDSSEKRSPKTVVTFLSGATAGCISTVVLQPFDVVKTRMQMSAAYNRSVHLQPALKLQPNAGPLATVRAIIRQDTAFGLWRGVTPSVLRNTMGVGVYFMTLNAITAQLSAPDGSLSDAATLTSGAAARSIAVLLLCPLSVVKTRMETVEYASKYNGIFHAMRTIAVEEGRRGLFSGLGPAIVRDAPFSAAYMFIYLRTKHILGRAVGLSETRSVLLRNHSTSTPTQTSNPSNRATKPSPTPPQSQTSSPTSSQASTSTEPQSSPVTSNAPKQSNTNSAPSLTSSPAHQSNPMLTRAVNFTSGAFGGGLATLITQPQDVIKTRMQLSPRSRDGTPTRYGSVGEATRRVFNEEGFYGFFRGSSPRFVKRILGSAITWMVFEETNAFYTERLKKLRGGNGSKQ